VPTCPGGKAATTALASGQKVQCYPSRHVGFSLFEAVGRYETADGLLESGESHWYNSPAFRNVSRSP
jgi:hypothetical protein